MLVRDRAEIMGRTEYATPTRFRVLLLGFGDDTVLDRWSLAYSSLAHASRREDAHAIADIQSSPWMADGPLGELDKDMKMNTLATVFRAGLQY